MTKRFQQTERDEHFIPERWCLDPGNTASRVHVHLPLLVGQIQARTILYNRKFTSPAVSCTRHNAGCFEVFRLLQWAWKKEEEKWSAFLRAGVPIRFEVGAWVCQRKQRSLLFCYEGFSENQGRVTGGERQISDSMNSSRWRGDSETLCSCFRTTFQSIPQGRPYRGNWFIYFFSSYTLQNT